MVHSLRNTVPPMRIQPPIAPFRSSGLAHPRIVIVDDVTARRQSLRNRLSQVATDLAFDSAPRWTPDSGGLPDLILKHIETNPATAPISSDIAALTARYGTIPIVAVSDGEDGHGGLAALRAGCRGYIPMTLAPAVAIAGLRLVLAGGCFVPDCLLDLCPGTTATEPAAETLGSRLGLTSRETDVLLRLKRGLQNKIIAYELGISESTVKVHVRSIMRKTSTTNRTQVVCMTRQVPAHASGGYLSDVR